jgi:hypothetical protein
LLRATGKWLAYAKGQNSLAWVGKVTNAKLKDKGERTWLSKSKQVAITLHQWPSALPNACRIVALAQCPT